MGYHRAGFDVAGVDITPQPRYPFEFVQADAMEFDLSGFDAIHASPPCQGYSTLAYVNQESAAAYPQLIGEVRDRLAVADVPYVIENVENAKREMRDPVTLCGSQFGLATFWPGNGMVGLRRHRLFESNVPIADPGPHDHSLLSVPVYGHGIGLRAQGRFKETKGCAQAAREVMGIDWMTRHELDESIPPAYTEFVGKFLMDAVAVPLAA